MIERSAVLPKNPSIYVPSDRLDEHLGIRALRALRWFDAATSLELGDAMEMPSSASERRIRNSLQVTLRRLVTDGYIVVRVVAWRDPRNGRMRTEQCFSITNQGRNFLARVIRRARNPQLRPLLDAGASCAR